MEVSFQSKDVIKLIFDYLQSRGLHWAANSLLIETDLTYEYFSEPFATIKEYCLEGRWEDVRKLLQPFQALFEDELIWKNIVCLLYRQRFCELCFGNRLEDAPIALKDIIEEITFYHTNEDYGKLVKEICDYYNHIVNKYKHVYAMKQVTRAEAFHQLFDFIYPTLESNGVKMRKTDGRLLNQLSKGLLFDQCSKYCYEKATGQLQKNEMLTHLDFCLDSSENITASLLCWIESLEQDDPVFRNKFLDRKVNVVEKQEQEGTLRQTSTNQEQAEKFDSTYHVNTPAREAESKADADQIHTTEATTIAVISADTTTNTIAASNLCTSNVNPTLLNGSVRSAWGDVVSSVTNPQKLLTDASTEIPNGGAPPHSPNPPPDSTTRSSSQTSCKPASQTQTGSNGVVNTGSSIRVSYCMRF